MRVCMWQRHRFGYPTDSSIASEVRGAYPDSLCSDYGSPHLFAIWREERFAADDDTNIVRELSRKPAKSEMRFRLHSG